MDAAEYPFPKEDEINLLDIFMVLLKYKLLILGFVFFSSAASAAICFFLPNIYRSEATIVPKTQDEAPLNPLSALGGLGGVMAEGLGIGGGGSLEKLETVLKSRNLTNRVINKHKLMPVIFSDEWNEKKKKWVSKESPTLQDGWKVIQDLLTIKVDIKKNNIKVSFDNEDPKTAQKVTDHYLTELSEVLRQEVLEEAAENKRFFRKQLEDTVDTLLQEKIYTMLAREIEKETFANAQKYYSFLVLDPPIVPDQDKHIRPKRVRIGILSAIVAFFLGVFLAFMLEYIHRLREEDPEKYQKLVQGLKKGKMGSGDA